MNRTHDPKLKSWVESANDPATDFPIQNLPFGVFASEARDNEPTIGVAIGDRVLDVPRCVAAGLLARSDAAVASGERSLNALMALDPDELSSFRAELSDLLRTSGESADRASRRRDSVLLPMSEVSMMVPAKIGDYTDFYASIHHATNVGGMFRPDNPLLSNYKYVPIGYHGRASSIVASGSPVRRPSGQTKAADAMEPSFGPTKMLDYESELGFFVGRGNALGEAIEIDDAPSRIFGFALVNDWSARDIQSWEYQPLGPFLAKNFATTISPWVVTSEAVEPYRVAAMKRPDGDPQPMKYLSSTTDRESGGLSLWLEVFIQTTAMRERGIPAERISRAPFAGMYWTPAQMLAHHASNGCNMRAGDLLASGTVSGDSPDSRGCLLELTWRGTQPLQLSSGEERRFLQDGDEVIMRGHLEREGRVRIGFGECRGTILPASAS